MSPRLSLTVALAGLLASAGCAGTHGLASHGQPRDPAALSLAGSVAGTTQDAAAWPSAQWWRVFADPQLDALVEQALAGSPGLEAADARLRQAVAQAGLADATRRPALAAGAQLLGMQIPESLAGPEIGGQFSAAGLLTLSLKYNPDFWGGDRARWQAALGQARAAAVEAQAARLELAANIARTYVALAQAHDALDAAGAEAARADALVALNEQRLRAGLDNRIALEQNRSAAAAARQQAQAAQQQIQALRNALASLAGAGPDHALSITRPQLADAGIALPSVLPSELLGRRPDVVAARWRIESAQRGVDASQAAFYPSVNLSALVGLAAGSPGELFGSDALLVNGGPALSLPLFDGGRRRQQLAVSQADYDLAVASYNQRLLDAVREVTDAVLAARALDAQLASTTEARDTAARAHAAVLQRHRAGLATQLEVLAAQKPLLQLEHQLATLQARRRSARIDLDQALGGGIDVQAPADTAASLH